MFHSGNKAGVGAAAATQDGSAHLSAICQDSGKFLRFHGVVGQVVRPDDRDTGVGLAENGTFEPPPELAHQSGGE